MPRDYLRDLDDPEKANAFIDDAASPNTSEISRAHAASTIYLAYKTRSAGEALREAAMSSEKYARRLGWATWALVAATLVLAAVTIYKG